MNAEEVLSNLEWISKVVNHLGPYQPIKKRMKINHTDKTNEIALVLNVPNTLKRKLYKIKLPYGRDTFIISDMLTEDFTPLNPIEYWKFTPDGYWILDPKKLPNCDKFLLTLKGRISPEALQKIIYVDESTNKDRDEDSDRYWVKCMIRDIELVENIWELLEIDDVNVAIKVGINKCFSTAIPPSYSRKIKATQRYFTAGFGKDREQLYRAWAEFRRSQQDPGCTMDEFVKIIGNLTTGELFEKYIHINDPFNIKNIIRDNSNNILPSYMSVQAITNLNLEKYAADGELIFEKKKYIDDIKGSMGI